MIVYSQRKEICDPRGMLSSIEALARCCDPRSGAGPLELLIETGLLEAAVMDCVCPAEDRIVDIGRQLRRMSLDAARLFCACSRNDHAGGEKSRYAAQQSAGALQVSTLPDLVSIGAAEGYAYYGLHPESYARLAESFCRRFSPGRVFCLGIRTIGTSLSAVVSASLEHLGIPVASWTVRPQGHPFQRLACFAESLKSLILEHAGDFFLIIDEGPGLSGSTVTAVARRLTELGVPDGKIIFFISRPTDGQNFICSDAQSRWSRHRHFAADCRIAGERVAQVAAREAASVRDISAGKWRRVVFATAARFPAAQPQHERLKFLLGRGSRTKQLLKFSGFGRYGKTAFERASRLAADGWGPPVLDCSGGFLRMQWLLAKPLAGSPTGGFLNRAAEYLAYLNHCFALDCPAPVEALRSMAFINTAEGLKAGPQELGWLDRYTRCAADQRICALDGRMLPQEWLQCADRRFIKADGVDHHQDHFFPGCQDIAWDAAGCLIEFELQKQAADFFLRRYTDISRDMTLKKRLGFYLYAYAAYRLGYVLVSAQSVSSPREKKRFLRQASKYRMCMGGLISWHRNHPFSHWDTDGLFEIQ